MHILCGSKTSLALFLICLAVSIAAPAQTFKTLANLSDTFGASPSAPLVQGIDGNLYGSGFYGGLKQDGTVFRVTPGGKLSLVHTFHGAEGKNANGLALETNGNLYGITANGGTDSAGNVFGFTSTGTLFTLHNFDVSDGQSPVGGLTLGPDGSTSTE